jgi:hypothetical protein
MPTAESSSAASRSRPVFISSTFRDMHAERDYLRAHVFPRLEEAVRARRHFLEPIDLRLGVETAQEETDEAREPLVLKVCCARAARRLGGSAVSDSGSSVHLARGARAETPF